MHDDKKREIVDTCTKMVRLDLVIGTSGNISTRVGDHVLITPASKNYDKLKAEDVMVLDLEGNVLEGDKNPSVESPTHLAIYRARKDILAVVHTHSVHATALAVTRTPLPAVLDEVVPKLGGDVRVASYAMPGTKELARNVVAALDMRSGVLMANHGALTCGKTLDEALDKSVLLERACKIYLLSLRAGEPHLLPDEVIEDESDIWKMLQGI